MNILVVYSTRTGNTRKVGQAIFDALPEHKTFLSVEEAEGESFFYDLVFAGFWAYRKSADQASRYFLSRMQCANAALYATAGAYPDSEHARLCLIHGTALLPSGTNLWGSFICQGRVDPASAARTAARYPMGHPHSMTPERRKRLEDASSHPDEADLERARQFALAVVAGMKQMGER